MLPEPSDRKPAVAALGAGITMIDTRMGGEPELNAVYLIAGAEPTLVETGPAADAPVVLDALRGLGIGPGDLAHMVVSHIHLDHAGGAGVLAREFPGARIWVHERGAAHLANPERLVASTARTYGPERMLALFGETVPVAADRLSPVDDGSRIPLGGDRSLEVIATPGHASHHIALHDTGSNAMFTGEAIGVHMPWAGAEGVTSRPALPAPEVDVEQALDSIARIRSRGTSRLLASHFGPVGDPATVCDHAVARIRVWSETVRAALEEDPDRTPDDVAEILRERALADLAEDGVARPAEAIDRYDALGSIRMNAGGLTRYWRKRWEAEGEASGPDEGTDNAEGPTTKT